MKLEISYKKKKNLENSSMWRLNNILLNNQWVKEEIKREIKKYLETNGNRNTTHQNLWVAVEVILRGDFNKQPIFIPQGARKRRLNKALS